MSMSTATRRSSSAFGRSVGLVLAAVLIASVIVLGQEPPPTPTAGATLAQARAAINAAVARASQRHAGIGFTFTVLGTDGLVKASVRMDNAVQAAADLAYLKAKTALYFLVDTTFFQNYGLTNPASGFFGFEITDGGFSSIPGGVVLRGPDNSLLGAIGVSGSFDPADDNDCATFAAAAVSSGATAALLVVPAGNATQGISAVDAAQRAETAVSAATTFGTNQTVCVVDAYGQMRVLLRMDGSLPLSVDYACRKARTTAAFLMRSEAVYPLVIPSGAYWTAAASNGVLAPYGGAFPLTLSSGARAGSIGCSGSYNASVDALQCQRGANAAAVGRTVSLPLEQALAAVQAAMDAAQAQRGPADAMGAWCTAVVVDNGGRLVAMARMDGMPPGSVELARKRALGAMYLGVENSMVLPFVQPGTPAFGAQFLGEGIVLDGGGVPLVTATGEKVGAIGIAAQTNATVATLIGRAAAAAYLSAAPLALSALRVPPFASSQGGVPYAGESVTLTQLIASGAAALSSAQSNGIQVAFAGVDGTGTLKLFVRMDGAVSGAVDLALQSAHSSYVNPFPSAMYQRDTAPAGSMYTETSANGLPLLQVLVPGGQPLLTNRVPQLAIGSVAVSSGMTQPTLDARVVSDAVTAFNAAYLAANPLFNPSAGAVGFSIAFAVMCAIVLTLLITVIRLRSRLNATSASGITGYQQYRQPLAEHA